ncbi:NTP_transf_2 domain-containing protein [Cephalotus follicularis]|uniref:NTP_transf_2 domain-containing protein n=1 Tax=Cephalotus follicularis TaxID=3775 RepID=A0A1Q3B3A6_CEPFO|nr:NTP_transf_2 domain-containing protein [Cephalotus follicularis]
MEDSQESLSSSSSLSSLFSSSSPPNPHLMSIDVEVWSMAEQRTREILCTIQPARASDHMRNEIINYIQRLIKGYYETEVFPFGSVPLKTYLPDGDIDLTAISYQHVEDLAKDVCSILEGKGQDSEFQVKDVQHIHAQVQIVKCTVNNIAVDISFNQLAGLSTLCFLEKVDQLIGKDHLFKSSVILIKAWCYYESRILCAHHGLISTYALETLVLHIINLFHSSLSGPLAVFYRFLNYYSTFDWENYCLSVGGPVAISSVPEVLVSAENEGDELLFSQEFLKYCRETFSVPLMAQETKVQHFPVKHLNIIDPLKDNNNLGRSVSKGNFHRIRCALSHSAQRLEEILLLPSESMGMGLQKFFMNTLDRNGRGQRPDLQVPVPSFGTQRSQVSDLVGDYDSYYTGLLYSQCYHNYTLPVCAQPRPLSSPSHFHNRSAWAAIRQWVRCKRNVFYRRGTDLYVPTLPFRHPYAATFCIDDRRKSRGTGTYIPDANSYSYREKWLRARYPESTRCSSPKSPQTTSRVEDPTNAKKGGNDDCLDLSLEEFPLLPVTKNLSLTNNYHSGQKTVQSPQTKGYSSCLRTIEFGTFGSSLLPSVAQKQQELMESDGEMDIPKPIQLTDDNEFPTLAIGAHSGQRRRR